MKRGFYSIMAAQFFSSLADNALFIAAVALLGHAHEPDWKKAALVPIFAVFYVLLAPFVGAFSDAHPKGRVMFMSNAIKAVGCLMMLLGVNPLLAYAVVGLGAASYSPAKYGILTELLPDFWGCNRLLWRDKLGQISLATTTLFWGVSGNLRYLVLAWAALALGYGETQASMLVGVVAVGTAVGAVWASLRVKLDRATEVMPLGILMGLVVLALLLIKSKGMAIPVFVLLGGLGGYLVVPMNALLQHRGHNLMGAGRSIAVQNFNEQACILGLGLLYSLLTKFHVSAFGAIVVFGLLVSGCMVLFQLWHWSNLKKHPAEVLRLLREARDEGPLGH